MRLWWCIGKYASFERSDGVGEGVGYGSSLSNTAFNAYENDSLGGGDSFLSAIIKALLEFCLLLILSLVIINS